MTQLQIPVSSLLFDTENYRLDDPKNQDEAFLQIVQEQKEKLIRLAKDIAQSGTNPSDLPIVLAYHTSGQYVVLEGNRRLAAIKLLTDATFAAKITDPNLKEKFKALRKDNLAVQIPNLSCLVVGSKAEADHWIELRHTGENDGVGIAKWDAHATERFSQHMGKTTFTTNASKIIEIVGSSGSINPLAKKLIKDIKLTNLARLINDSSVRKALNVQITNGIVSVDLSKPETAEIFEKIIKKMADPKFAVGSIYHKKDRADFITSLNASPQPASTAQPAPGPQPTPTTKPSPLSQNRSTLIPVNFVLTISQPRINQIYTELRSLDVTKYTNCAAVMFRVFLELSLDEYWIRTNPPGFTNEKLYDKIKKTTNYMETNNILTTKKLAGVRKAADSNSIHSIFSTNTLNQYVHNPSLAPIARELNLAWDNLQEFVIQLWP